MNKLNCDKGLRENITLGTNIKHKFIRKYIKNGSIYLEYTDGLYIQKSSSKSGILSTWLEKVI